jgi:hypothetical protein
MEDNDNTRGSGRGVGIGIKKVKEKGRGKHKTNLSHSSIFQAPRPADTQPPYYTRQPINIQQPQSTRQPTHHPISQTHTNLIILGCTFFHHSCKHFHVNFTTSRLPVTPFASSSYNF